MEQWGQTQGRGDIQRDHDRLERWGWESLMELSKTKSQDPPSGMGDPNPKPNWRAALGRGLGLVAVRSSTCS